MKEFLDYHRIYPNLLIEICIFFSEFDTKDGKNVNRELLQFCSFYKNKYNTTEYPQPRIISKICDALTDIGQLMVIYKGGVGNIKNSYHCILDPVIKSQPAFHEYYNKKLSYIVFGFKYIYEDFQQYILPIEYTAQNGDKSLGTCFLYKSGIATAKHCIEGAKSISIQGVPKSTLNNATYEIYENEAMDILYIRFIEPLLDTISASETAEILDEVMTMGFPKIAGYHNFLTAENAIVSARFTASIGQIASNAEDIWIRERLFLITAKIKGGNSGGPVVNKKGSIVGIAVNLSEGKGDYDELGYGTVIPISFLDELIIQERKNYLDVSKIEFKDFDIG